ncbi:MAG: dihydropteroate synthase [Bacteroidia bacterium]
MKPQDTVFYQKIDRIFDLTSPPLIMGILNITPDSFFDGGKFNTEKEWLTKAAQLVEDGADIIDIGAYSTRPSANFISIEEEAERLIPAIISIKKEFNNIIISADTFRATIAEKAIAAGANIINDISGGSLDENMFRSVAQLQVPYILMHTKGNPQNMQNLAIYTDVVKEVTDYFKEKVDELNKLNFFKIIIDPGFGFAKTVQHNFQLLNQINNFKIFNLPILVGLSRKSMATKLLNIKTADALNVSTVLNTLALNKGVNILRVHDVKEAKEVITIHNYMNNVNE